MFIATESVKRLSSTFGIALDEAAALAYDSVLPGIYYSIRIYVY